MFITPVDGLNTTDWLSPHFSVQSLQLTCNAEPHSKVSNQAKPSSHGTTKQDTYIACTLQGHSPCCNLLRWASGIDAPLTRTWSSRRRAHAAWSTRTGAICTCMRNHSACSTTDGAVYNRCLPLEQRRHKAAHTSIEPLYYRMPTQHPHTTSYATMPRHTSLTATAVMLPQRPPLWRCPHFRSSCVRQVRPQHHPLTHRPAPLL